MTIDEFSKKLIEQSIISLSEKYGSKCSHCGKSPCECDKEEVKEEKNKEGKERGADGKACWKGYKYAGTENGKDKCVKMKEEKEDESEAEEEKEKKMSKSAKEKHEKAEEKKEKEMKEAKNLPGNQEKIDANKNGKVDAHDFALLRAKKGKKSVKEMWEIVEAKKKVEIEIMPQVDTPNDPEPPTGRKVTDDIKKKLKKEEKEGASKESEKKFHTKLDKLVHKTFGKSPDEKKMKKEEVEPLEEKKLSAAEKAKKEKFVKGMKKKYGSFKSKYGERAKEVMYATATKMGKKAA